ncbi:hypothetical protein Tco_0928548 [Tanacetum coccineum]
MNNSTIRLIILAETLTGSNFTNWYRNMRIVLRYEKKQRFVEQPIGPATDPATADPDTIDKYYESVNIEQEVACLMLSKDGQSVCSYLLKMKSYLDALERLGYAMLYELGMIAKLHAMLKLHEKGIPKKAETPTVLAIREGRIQEDKKKPQGAKGKDKGKIKLAYAPKPKIPPSPKRDNPAKDSIFHHCKEVGHWRRNFPSYHAKLKKRKNANGDLYYEGQIYVDRSVMGIRDRRVRVAEKKCLEFRCAISEEVTTEYNSVLVLLNMGECKTALETFREVQRWLGCVKSLSSENVPGSSVVLKVLTSLNPIEAYRDKHVRERQKPYQGCPS